MNIETKTLRSQKHETHMCDSSRIEYWGASLRHLLSLKKLAIFRVLIWNVVKVDDEIIEIWIVFLVIQSSVSDQFATMAKLAFTLAILNVILGVSLSLFTLFNMATLEKEPGKFKSNEIASYNKEDKHFNIQWIILVSDGETSFFTPTKNKYSLLALLTSIHFLLSINMLIKLIEVSLKKCQQEFWN